MTGMTIWTGVSIGVLKVVDWLLTAAQKRKLSSFAETAWLWLSDQRAGRFTSLVRSPRVQRAFSIFTHVSMLAITLAFLARVFWGVRIDAQFQLGHPRVYLFQVWIDAVALAVSALFLSWWVHPRIALWIASAPSLPRYFGRALKAFGLCILAAITLVVLQYPITGFSSPAFRYDTLDEIRFAYEQMLGGQPGVVAVHALTALVSAPVVAEWMLVQTILFLSLYWIIAVWLMILLFRFLQFILIRIVDSKDGPVLALSGVLVGVGAVAKVFLD